MVTLLSSSSSSILWSDDVVCFVCNNSLLLFISFLFITAKLNLTEMIWIWCNTFVEEVFSNYFLCACLHGAIFLYHSWHKIAFHTCTADAIAFIANMASTFIWTVVISTICIFITRICFTFIDIYGQIYHYNGRIEKNRFCDTLKLNYLLLWGKGVHLWRLRFLFTKLVISEYFKKVYVYPAVYWLLPRTYWTFIFPMFLK